MKQRAKISAGPTLLLEGKSRHLLINVSKLFLTISTYTQNCYQKPMSNYFKQEHV